VIRSALGGSGQGEIVMAMVKCKECGQSISNKAKSCPSCGAPIKKKTSILTWIVSVILSIIVIQSVIVSSGSNTVSTRDTSLPRVENSHQGNPVDIHEAEEFLSQLPPACSSSNAQALSDGTVSIRIVCRGGDKSMDGLVEIKDGIVRKIR
jgi:ribosomal protein L37E